MTSEVMDEEMDEERRMMSDEV